MIKNGLRGKGYVQSKAEPCLFYKEYQIIATYVEDSVTFTKDYEQVASIIKSLEPYFKLTDKEELNLYLSIDISKNSHRN